MVSFLPYEKRNKQNMNNVSLIGNLTRDPELRFTQSGTAVCSMSIAYNKRFKKGDEVCEEVSFFDVVSFGGLAETCAQYLNKGSKVAVSGELRQDRWETTEGDRRSAVKIVGSRVDFLTSKQAQGDAEDSKSAGDAGDQEVPF